MGKANLKRPRIGIIPALPSLLSLDHSSCTFAVIGSILLARYFQIWSTVAGYDE